MKAKATLGRLKQQEAETLIKNYLPLIKRIAQHLMSKLPKCIQLDDLIQAGMVGLLIAAKNYNPQKGASFDTYAVIRIRGTMLDEVRKENWLPRSVHRNARRLEQITLQLESELGRDAHDNEIANALHVSMTDYRKLLAEQNAKHVFNIEDAANENGLPIDEMLFNSANDPYEDAQFENFYFLLLQGMQKLSERERHVLKLYYDDELSLKEIGVRLGVSESRICQIHHQAMVHLKSKLFE